MFSTLFITLLLSTNVFAGMGPWQLKEATTGRYFALNGADGVYSASLAHSMPSSPFVFQDGMIKFTQGNQLLYASVGNVNGASNVVKFTEDKPGSEDDYTFDYTTNGKTKQLTINNETDLYLCSMGNNQVLAYSTSGCPCGCKPTTVDVLLPLIA